jgi:hypothetical protein
MNFKQKRNAAYRLIPESKKKCVWMEAGLVSYKICDRNFECESCPLDYGLRGSYDKAVLNQPKQKTLKLRNHKKN